MTDRSTSLGMEEDHHQVAHQAKRRVNKNPVSFFTQCFSFPFLRFLIQSTTDYPLSHGTSPTATATSSSTS
ncbi:hypothetical protein RIF29_40509 [Crotalaria pallida]|uniref:Uncharacterized protein n=1 Tax=Crotalaria pallida TaxID=3830 RepID=A0AAN9E413_CROPI